VVVNFNDNTGYPIVRFSSGLVQEMSPKTFQHTLSSGIQVQRVQVPLMLAWALTIHKAQGLTLDWAIVNLDDAFDFGMVYVACSRVRSQANLQILGVDHSKIDAHPAALAFYALLPERLS
jgi:ATP-dependent DNA helicase PIF1